MAIEQENCETTTTESREQTTDNRSTEAQKQRIESISGEKFAEWHTEREFRRNIRRGTPYFNGPSPIKSPKRHSPSGLLQCHRKITYKQLNAPAESSKPTGIFWIGSQFEEKIALPFLREVVSSPGEYVTNSLWVDFTENTEAGEIRFKGETDPVIVNADAEPLLLTEIKTKESVENVDSPNRHHRAQAHAYMKGLSEKYDQKVTDAVILYGGRTNLEVRAFHIEFDPWFWTETVVKWAETHTDYRLDKELPPADPEFNWECQFCSYRERCGNGESNFKDIGATGFLPGLRKYPEEQITDYLKSNEEKKLTPVLASLHPDLEEEYEVYDWECRECGAEYSWDCIEWDVDELELPPCPNCSQVGRAKQLKGPRPADQLGGGTHDSE